MTGRRRAVLGVLRGGTRGACAAILLLAAGALSGCAAHEDCVNAEFERPFGRRFQHFFQMIGSYPAAIAEDTALRRKNLAQAFRGIGDQIRTDASRTAAHPLPDLVGDAREHWPQLTASLWGLTADVGEDFRCAVPRVWHELKLLE